MKYILAIMAAVFITLRLCGVIAWSWWWVLAPLWIPVGLFVLWVMFIFVCLCTVTAKDR